MDKSFDILNNDFSFETKENNTIEDDGFIDESINNILYTPTSYHHNTTTTNVVEDNLLKKCIRNYNTWIYIYNINVYLFQKTAVNLEQYLKFIFNSIKTCFIYNTYLLRSYVYKNTQKKIFIPNLNLITRYSKFVYTVYKEYLYLKIEEIKSYLKHVEITLIKQSWILIRGRFLCSNYLLVLSDKQGLQNYYNLSLERSLDRICKQLCQLLDYIIQTHDDNYY